MSTNPLFFDRRLWCSSRSMQGLTSHYICWARSGEVSFFILRNLLDFLTWYLLDYSYIYYVKFSQGQYDGDWNTVNIFCRRRQSTLYIFILSYKWGTPSPYDCTNIFTFLTISNLINSDFGVLLQLAAVGQNTQVKRD